MSCSGLRCSLKSETISCLASGSALCRHECVRNVVSLFDLFRHAQDANRTPCVISKTHRSGQRGTSQERIDCVFIGTFLPSFGWDEEGQI